MWYDSRIILYSEKRENGISNIISDFLHYDLKISFIYNRKIFFIESD